LKAPDHFKFTYNKVTFLHPAHPELADLRQAVDASLEPISDFFKRQNFIIGPSNSNIFSPDLAEQQAVSLLWDELGYLNFRLKANAWAEKI